MRYYSLLSLFFLALLVTACGGSTEVAETMEEAVEEVKEAVMAEVSLTPMPDAVEFPDATIEDWGYAGGKFTYATSGYEFAAQTPDADAIMCANSGKGQHAHLIVNNEPYIAKYEPEFEQALPDGSHHILTFLSRSYHLSIKNGKAHRAVKAEVKDGAFASTEDITEPMLFYSRPKGSYKGAANTENIMLDFYPVNVELGTDGYAVKAVVNGKEEFTITEWQPYFLKGLPMGENTVELTLLKDGIKVDAPLNPVSRTFTLEALPTEG